VTTFAVLGSLRVASDAGQELRFGRTKRRLLLRLLAEEGRPLPVASIGEAVWDDDQRRNRHNLQSHVHQLRAMLGGERIETVGRSYRLNVSDYELDSRLFERRVETAVRVWASHQPALAGHLLHSALGLWRGPAWSEVADLYWAHSQAARLNQLRLEAEGLLLEARLAAGDSVPAPAWPHPAGAAALFQSSRGQPEGAPGHVEAVGSDPAADRRPAFGKIPAVSAMA